jgi:hypothetical protein
VPSAISHCRAALAALALLPSLPACSALRIGAGPALDAGTLGVSGVGTGIGAHVEAIAYRERAGSGLGAGPALAIAGYSTSGDGDPIVFATLELRARRSSAHAFAEVGTGAGAAWAPGPIRLAVPLQAEAGLRATSGPLELSVGLRERFIGLVGTGSPPTDAHNSLQLVVGIGALRRAAR